MLLFSYMLFPPSRTRSVPRAGVECTGSPLEWYWFFDRVGLSLGRFPPCGLSSSSFVFSMSLERVIVFGQICTKDYYFGIICRSSVRPFPLCHVCRQFFSSKRLDRDQLFSLPSMVAAEDFFPGPVLVRLRGSVPSFLGYDSYRSMIVFPSPGGFSPIFKKVSFLFSRLTHDSVFLSLTVSRDFFFSFLMSFA